jgi:spore germination protein YaaH
MHEIGVVVSVDITRYEKTSLQWSMCYDRDRLAEYADYIMLMAYDQYYAGSKTAGPVGGLTWVEDSVKLTLSEVPAEKLVLGMPFYVRIWETKNGKKLGTKSVSMDSALKQIEENNATAQYDAQHDLIKYSWTKGGKTYMLWLENAQTIVQRVRLAKKYSLAGVASWRRGLESRDVWTKIAEEASK